MDGGDTLNGGFADCNNNGIEDSVDIATGTSADANLDGVPDECQDDITLFCSCLHGAPCNNEGALCDPGIGCGVNLVCARQSPVGRWGCPRSRRRYKRDINYLSREELSRYHDEIMNMRLATWRYRNVPNDREHLGFIIEDVEPSLSVDSSHDRVDVYGFTSMAVAALQVQSQRIEELERTVRALREQAAIDR